MEAPAPSKKFYPTTQRVIGYCYCTTWTYSTDIQQRFYCFTMVGVC